MSKDEILDNLLGIGTPVRVDEPAWVWTRGNFSICRKRFLIGIKKGRDVIDTFSRVVRRMNDRWCVKYNYIN